MEAIEQLVPINGKNNQNISFIWRVVGSPPFCLPAHKSRNRRSSKSQAILY